MTLIVPVTLPLGLVFGFIFAAMLTSDNGLAYRSGARLCGIGAYTPTLAQMICGFLLLNVLGDVQNNLLTPFLGRYHHRPADCRLSRESTARQHRGGASRYH